MEHVGDFAAGARAPAKQKKRFACGFVDVTYFKEYKQYHFSLSGYSLHGQDFTFAVPMECSDFSLLACRNHFLAKLRGWHKRNPTIRIHVSFSRINTVEKSRPSLSEQSLHFYRMEDRQWTYKRPFNKGYSPIKTHGMILARSELRQDTALHHNNCGLPMDEKPLDNWKFDPKYTDELMPTGCKQSEKIA